MGRGVAVQALELQRGVQQQGHGLVAVPLLAQARLDLDGLGQGHRVGGVGRHHLGQAVHLAERQLQHPAHIAQHGARLQGAEGDDLGHAVAAIALLDVGDHLFPPLLAEVDIEVGHRHPLRIEEALEQQAVAKRVEVGDGQGIGHERTRARTPPWTHWDTARLGPLDEVRHDQEVAGEPHLGDDPDLPLKPGLIVLYREGVGLAARHPRLQAFAGLVSQFLGFRAAGLTGEARQDRVALLDHEGAAPGDIDGVVTGLGQVGEQSPHVGRRLEPVLVGDPAALVLADEGAVGDAQQRLVGLVHLLGGEIDVVGGHQGHVVRIGEGDQVRLSGGLGRRAVPLQLDIEPVPEHPGHLGQGLIALGGLAGREQGIDGAVGTARQQDQPLGMLGHQVPRRRRLGHPVGFHIGVGREHREIEVALFRLGQEHDGRGLGPSLSRLATDPGHRQGAADNGLDPGVLGGD